MSARTPVPASAPEALPLIETKLALGRLRPERLIRQRLLAELDRFSSAALTLIDAPVGFGKTVLAQTWCAHTDAAVAWVSLDAGDNDPVRFWTYVATSVDRIRPGLGRMALVAAPLAGRADDRRGRRARQRHRVVRRAARDRARRPARASATTSA